MQAARLKEQIGVWITKKTEVIPVDENTYEIATIELDAYGDTVYCFVTEEKDGRYLVSDDSHLLFKLDPGMTDHELYQTAARVVIGAGFNYDEKSSAISVLVDQENVAQAIVRLAQLQIAISYL